MVLIAAGGITGIMLNGYSELEEPVIESGIADDPIPAIPAEEL